MANGRASGNTEVEDIGGRYARRASIPASRYSFASPDVFRQQATLDRAIYALLMRNGYSHFPELRLLEVGCGGGGNVLRFLRWGFDPAHIVANELLPERIAAARRALPDLVTILPGDARSLASNDQFDIVFQSTVMSSILDNRFQEELAHSMWELVAPGGILLSYDFAVNNPRNGDVRGVPVSRIRELFPRGDRYDVRLVTLAPPIARLVARSGPAFSVLNAVVPLRTHRLVAVRKPV